METLSPDQDYLKSRTLLYVEDDETTREQFIYCLSGFAGNLVTAVDGAEWW